MQSKCDKCETLIDQLIQIQSANQIALFQTLEEMKKLNRDPGQLTIVEGSRLELLHSGLIKITVNEWHGKHSPIYDTKGNLQAEAYRQAKIRWYNAIGSAVLTAKDEYGFVSPVWENAFIYLKLYLPIIGTWDADNHNRSLKLIIDACVRTRLIKDDSWQNLAYSVRGFVDKGNPRTEIFIINNAIDLLEKMVNQET